MKYWMRFATIAGAFLVILYAVQASVAQGASHWPASISGPDGFRELGQSITKDPGFPTKGSAVEKARFVFSRLPEIAKTYSLEAGSGGKLSDIVIGINREVGSDPEGADSLKGCTGWGNCGEWSYAFSEILGGAGVQSRVVYADKAGGTGHSGEFTGTDTTLIVEERTPNGAISRRVFDAFRAAYHGDGSRPTSGSVAEWGDRPLTVNDKLPRDAGQITWQEKIGGKPFIKDATSETELPPHKPIDVQERQRLEQRDAARKKAEEERRRKEEEERKRKEEEEKRKAEEMARRKAAIQGALKQAEALVAAARTAAGRAQAALAAVKGASASGSAATSTANAAQGAAQQARGAVDAARSACARVVSEGVIDAARARAEAAAGEVGSRYQEVVDLAKEACQAAGQVQKASNADARRILATKTEALAARAQSRAASAQASAGRARTEAAQAAQHHANRQAAMDANAAAKAAIAAARGQISTAEGALQSQEATVGGAQGQLGAARTAGDEVERNKAAARGVLGPFLSEPEAQMMIPVINGVVAPSIEGVDQPIQQALNAIQQARAAVMTAREQLAGWEGGLGACEALAPTDGLVQAAQAAASTAELFLPKISGAAGQASQCAGLAGGGSPGSPADVKGATEAGGQFQGQTPGGQASGPTSGASGGGPPIEQSGTGEPPTGGTGGPVGPGAGQWITCYSEKTKQSYPMPYGSVCPPPHLPPPTVGGTPHDPRTPWQELVPEKGGGGGGHGGGKGGGHSKPSKRGTTGGSGPTSPPTCPPGCHIKPGTNKCHCGGG